MYLNQKLQSLYYNHIILIIYVYIKIKKYIYFFHHCGALFQGRISTQNQAINYSMKLYPGISSLMTRT